MGRADLNGGVDGASGDGDGGAGDGVPGDGPAGGGDGDGRVDGPGAGDGDGASWRVGGPALDVDGAEDAGDGDGPKGVADPDPGGGGDADLEPEDIGGPGRWPCGDAEDGASFVKGEFPDGPGAGVGGDASLAAVGFGFDLGEVEGGIDDDVNGPDGVVDVEGEVGAWVGDAGGDLDGDEGLLEGLSEEARRATREEGCGGEEEGDEQKPHQDLRKEGVGGRAAAGVREAVGYGQEPVKSHAAALRGADRDDRIGHPSLADF